MSVHLGGVCVIGDALLHPHKVTNEGVRDDSDIKLW